MRIEYVATPKDVSAIYFYCWRHSSYFQRRMIFYAVLFGLCLAIVLPPGLRITLGVTFAFLYPFSILYIAKIRTKKDRRTLSIDSTGIHTQVGRISGDIPWPKIAGVYCSEEYIYLLGRSLNGFSIPRSAFANPEDADIFLQQCRQYTSRIKLTFYRRLDSVFPVILTASVTALYLIELYAAPIGILLMTKRKIQSAPEMWLVPKPLTLTPDNSIGGKKLSFFGYEFNSPWAEVRREKNYGTIAVLGFSNGGIIAIIDERQKKETDELINHFQSGVKNGHDEVYGKNVMISGYALQSKVLQLTPQDLRIFSKRTEMLGNSFLLQLKPMWTRNIKGNLYSFQTEWVRGFQEGSPGRDDTIKIQVFDSQDREIEFFVKTEPQVAGIPSQGDINHILNSLRPAADLTYQANH